MFVVAIPERVSSHCTPARSLRWGFATQSMLTGSVHATWTMIVGWSCRFRPTPGKSSFGSMPTERRCSAGPMPETIMSWGELMAPPERMTSRSARAARISPWR